MDAELRNFSETSNEGSIFIKGNNADSNESDGFFSSIIQKISDNKMYIIIGISVIVLGVVLYYIYNKNMKGISENMSEIKHNHEQKHILEKISEHDSESENDSEIKNPDNTPELVNEYIVKQTPENKITQKIKLEHPDNSDVSSDKSEEDNDMKQYNLTNSELDDIKNKLSNIEQ